MSSPRTLRNIGLGVAAAIPLSLAMAGQAQAVPYAFAANVDTNFMIAAVAGSGSYTPSAGTFSTVNGISSSFLPGNIVSATGNGFGASDAPQVYSGPGPAPAQNFFAPALAGVTSAALRADSLDTGFAGGGGNVAEGNLQNGPAGGDGHGSGKLNSNNTSTIAMSVAGGTKLTVSFNDDVNIQASSRALAGETASGAISSSVTIQRNGVTVFTFAPDGSGLGDVTGGTVTSDPYSLNFNVGTSSGGSLTGSYTKSGGFFSATTNSLADGDYTIIVNQQSNIDLQIGAARIPEPASMALLGAGLLGFGVIRRNRKSS
ncbi:MAG: hypothetical protein NVSMB18_02850 [Acetobacteraceae bacterium]